MDDEMTMKFELTPEETRTYQEWVKKMAEDMAGEDEAGLDAVTISFVQTAMGTGVIAHIGKNWREDPAHIILRDIS